MKPMKAAIIDLFSESAATTFLQEQPRFLVRPQLLTLA